MMRVEDDKGFQRAEYLLEHGMLDRVLRISLRCTTMSRVLHLLLKQAKPTSKILPMPVRNGSGRNGNGNAAATS